MAEGLYKLGEFTVLHVLDKVDFQHGKEEKSLDELRLSGKKPLFPICRVF